MFCMVASSTTEHTYLQSECFCDSCPPLEPEAWARPQDLLQHSRCGCAPAVPGGLAPTGPFGKKQVQTTCFFFGYVLTANRRFSRRETAVLPSHQVWTWGVCERHGGTGLGPVWVRSQRRSLSRWSASLTTAVRLMPGPRRSLSSRDFSWLCCREKRGWPLPQKLQSKSFIAVTAQAVWRYHDFK